MPGVLGGVASIFAVGALAGDFDKDYFTAMAAGGNKLVKSLFRPPL